MSMSGRMGMTHTTRRFLNATSEFKLEAHDRTAAREAAAADAAYLAEGAALKAAVDAWLSRRDAHVTSTAAQMAALATERAPLAAAAAAARRWATARVIIEARSGERARALAAADAALAAHDRRVADASADAKRRGDDLATEAARLQARAVAADAARVAARDAAAAERQALIDQLLAAQPL